MPSLQTLRNGQRGRAIAAFAVVLVLLSACASSSQGKLYQSIAACNAAEQTAIRSFGVFYQAHKAENPTLWGDRYDKAMAAHAAYEKIRDAAVDAAKTNGETSVILASVNAALGEVTTLLASFGVK